MKTRISHSEARLLTERFLEGITSDREEQQLYEYFHSGDVAEDLSPLREMFGWYESHTPTSASPIERRRFTVKFFATIAACGAAAVMLVATVLTAYHTSDTRRDMMELQGSYIIRNGEKITDLATIYPDLKRAERIASEPNEATDFDLDESMLEVALENVHSPQAQEALRNALN